MFATDDKHPEELRTEGHIAGKTEGLLEGKCVPEKEGPLSPAPVIAPRKMYAYVTKAGRKEKNNE